MIYIFTNPDLFMTINKFTDLRSLCDTGSFGKNQEFQSKVNKGKQSFPLGSLFATLKNSFMYYDDILFNNMFNN